MATKLKKHNPFMAFFIYFLSFSLFIGTIVGILCALASGGALDSKQTRAYQQTIIPNLLESCYILSGNGPEYDTMRDYYSGENISPEIWAKNQLQYEGGNLEYLVVQDGNVVLQSSGAPDTIEAFTSMAKDGIQISGEQYRPTSIPASTDGFDHFLLLSGTDLYELMNTRMGQREESTSLGMSRYRTSYFFTDQTSIGPNTEKITICLAIRAEGAFQNFYGRLYENYYYWYSLIIGIVLFAVGAIISLLVFLVVRLKKQSLAIAKAKFAAVTGWFWFEIKLFVAFCTVCLGICMFIQPPDTLILFIPTYWLFWLLFNDYHHNRHDFFRHNSFRSVKRAFQRLDSKYPFCARMKRRFVYLIGIEAALLFLMLFFLLFGPFGIILDIFAVALGIFLLFLYTKTYFQDVDTFTDIMDYATKIRAGTAKEPLKLRPNSAFAPLAADLNDIHSGMAHMVEEQVHSEKMKVELITNVSHDLKTPLTSIINYVDLLGKEELSPDFANDYVKVLEGKAERLKNLVQDLFEISKANSGAIDLHLEQINIQSLVEQTVAELDERSTQAGVELKLQLCEPPLTVRADGKKLHRVFENLLGNALKYSLSGTRVYISVTQEDNDAQVSFKNVASYEMNFTADEIVERFQRGDTSRTSEGSGLGLAIAKSFLELNGGSLRIELDGDLFKAIVRIPLYTPYEQRFSTTTESEPPSDGESVEPTASVAALESEQPATAPQTGTELIAKPDSGFIPPTKGGKLRNLLRSSRDGKPPLWNPEKWKRKGKKTKETSEEPSNE